MPLAEENGACSHAGFNGQLHEPATCWQILGNGYRAFNPVLMRFQSPDRLSPFQEGGINAYAFALADPINQDDPTGQYAQFIGWGALALGVGAGVGAAISHATGQKGALDVLAVAAAGLAAVAAMVATARFIPGKLSPKKFGQQPSKRERLAWGDMRLYHMKDGTHLLDMHGRPGVGILGGWPAGPDAVAEQVRLAAGNTPIKQV